MIKRIRIFFSKFGKMLFNLCLYLSIAAAVVLGISRLAAILMTGGQITTSEAAPKARVAIVFGAGLTRDGGPSLVLRDRVAAAAQLYFDGKVERLLMSGDNRFVYYNEPEAMRQYAIGLGVPEEAIVLDYAGRRTYDTCYRAGYIFGVTEAILVTQNFHLPRALILCNAMGLKATGVASDISDYTRSTELVWQIRELPATMVAFIEAYITHPEPVLGDKELIFYD